MKRYVILCLMLFFVHFTYGQQQNFAKLRQEYNRLSNRQMYDSALTIAFKAQPIAEKEFGATSWQNTRTLNFIGALFVDLQKYDTSIVYLKKALKLAKSVPNAPDTSVWRPYYNLSKCYIRKRLKDSANFYASKTIEINREMLGENTLSFLGIIDYLPEDMEEYFDFKTALPYYKVIIETRSKVFGKWSKEFIQGIDSILRSEINTNTLGRRRGLFHFEESLMPVKTLDSLLETDSVKNDFKKTFLYATELMDQSLKQYGDSNAMFFKGVKHLGLAYHNWLHEDSVAQYCLKKGMSILKSQNRVNSLPYQELSAASSSIYLDIKKYENTSPAIFQTPLQKKVDLPEYTTATETKLMLPIGHPEGVLDAEFSPDGRYIVSHSYNDLNAKVWSTITGELIFNLPTEAGVGCAFFTPDGKAIITALSNDKAIIWDFKTGKKRVAFATEGNDSFFSTVDFIPSKNLMITSHKNNILDFWDYRNGNLVKRLKFKDTVEYIHTSKNDSILFVVTKKQNRLSSVIGYNYITGKTQSIVTDKIFSYTFSINNFVILYKGCMILYDLDSYQIKSTVPIKKDEITGSKLSLFGDKAIISYADTTVFAYDTMTGALGSTIGFNAPEGNAAFTDIGENYIYNYQFGAYLLQTSVPVIDHKILYQFKRDTSSRLSRSVRPFINFSKDKKHVLMVFEDNVIRMWNVEGSKPFLEQTFSGKTIGIQVQAFDEGYEHFAIGNQVGEIKVFNIKKGLYELGFNASKTEISHIAFSKNSKFIATSSSDSSCMIWAWPSGNLIGKLKHADPLSRFDISLDAKSILTSTYKQYIPGKSLISDSAIRIWDWEANKIIKTFFTSAKQNASSDAMFGTDNKKILYVCGSDSTIRQTDIATGNVIKIFHCPEWPLYAKESRDGKSVIAYSQYNVVVFDAVTAKLLNKFKVDNSTGFSDWGMTWDSKYLLTGTTYGLLQKWDFNTGELLQSIRAHISACRPTVLPGDSIFVTSSEDGTVKVWNLKKMKLLYQIVTLSKDDYIITDPYGRYDGTEGARKLLYFTCGTEVIGLDQVKDQLWVPNLAERIMKGDSINAKKLSDLDICGLVPELEKEEKTGYHFNITPRRGGLGETVLLVNDIEVKRYQPNQLAKTATGYELNVTEQELQTYFIAGKLNPVTVKAYTAKNDIASRGVQVMQDETKKQAATPNLYAVMIGVSDYKGTELQLKYAAKDATDISAAVAASAGKLLGKGHVFTYNLTTSANHYQLPEKIAIKNVFGEIGKKATANDILLVFFAGHGVTSGEKKQFYFLTADASANSAIDAPADVGISTVELTEWMKPSILKAQKRILILDACNSGQAINELEHNALGTRSDDKAEQIKAIDKLNEKSGLFILAASASNQSAYEMGRYSQGLLTYSLLKAIKQQPDILEDGKYLNVSRWFNVAEKTVSDMVRETGNRQEPQLVSAGNFNIGVVDQEVMSGIKLAEEKPLFTTSNLQNNDLAIDNLHLNRLLDNQLNEISARGYNNNISYVPASISIEAYSLGGRYTVQGDELNVKVNISQNDETKFNFELTGRKDDLKGLAEQIIKKVTDWILKKK